MAKFDFSQLFNGIKDSVISSVIEDAKEFLDDNDDAASFLKEQAADLAQLAVKYAKSTDDSERQSILFSMKLVEQSVKNKVAGIAVQAEAQARAAFARTVQSIITALVKAAPAIISAAI